jgi:hypothetical protein
LFLSKERIVMSGRRVGGNGNFCVDVERVEFRRGALWSLFRSGVRRVDASVGRRTAADMVDGDGDEEDIVEAVMRAAVVVARLCGRCKWDAAVA